MARSTSPKAIGYDGRMRHVWPFILSVAIILGIGLSALPRPCIGDGEGNACRPEACACVQACTCQLVHEAERRMAAVPECCRLPGHDAAMQASVCHGPNASTHFSPPVKDGFALLPARFALTLPASPAPVLVVLAPVWPASRALPPPVRPPWSFA